MSPEQAAFLVVLDKGIELGWRRETPATMTALLQLVLDRVQPFSLARELVLATGLGWEQPDPRGPLTIRSWPSDEFIRWATHEVGQTDLRLQRVQVRELAADLERNEADCQLRVQKLRKQEEGLFALVRLGLWDGKGPDLEELARQIHREVGAVHVWREAARMVRRAAGGSP